MVFPFLGGMDIISFCGLLFSRCLVVSDFFSLCIVRCYCDILLGLVSTEAVLSVLWVIGQHSDFDAVPVSVPPRGYTTTLHPSPPAFKARLADCLGRGRQAIQSWTNLNLQ